MSVPQVTRLTSRQHAVVRRFRQVAKGDDPDVVLIDGEHLLSEALKAHLPVDLVLTDGRAQSVAGRARAAGASVYEGSRGVLEAASPVRTPGGIVALVKWQTATVADALAGEHARCLGLAGVQDPGNVGSAIRAADALGATGVVALEGTADPRGWKALRGAMGSAFHLPIGRGTVADAVARARGRGLAVVASVATGGTPIEKADLRSACLILLGGEGAGLAPGILALADRHVTVPMRAGVESLNVAATAAILLFEARRQHQVP